MHLVFMLLLFGKQLYRSPLFLDGSSFFLLFFIKTVTNAWASYIIFKHTNLWDWLKRSHIIHTRCRETLFLFFPGNTEVLNEIEENQCNLEKKSTEGMDQLKKKINELQSVSMESVVYKIAHQC